MNTEITGNDKFIRNNLFDLIKMVCILMVIITHISWTESERLFFVFPLVIDMAVPCFMIISSYLRAKKVESLGLKQFTSFKYSFISLMNLMVAYVIVFFIEIVAALLLRHFGLGGDLSFLDSFSLFIKWFLTGLTGPGSYYVPIMVQLIFYFPIIYYLFKKGRNKGIIS